MTTELTKAAQQALEALKLCYAVVEYPANGTSRQDKAIAALERALTQRPAAQTEQATPEPVGEPVARVELMQTGGNAGLATRIVEIDDPLRERLRPGDLLFTHPAPGVPEGFDVQALTATGGGHKYPLIVVRDKSSQLGEDVFPDEHPVIYGLLSAWLAAAQAKGEQP